MADVAASAAASATTGQAVAASAALSAVAALWTNQVRVTQAGVEVLVVTSPNVRVTQAGIEVITPTVLKARAISSKAAFKGTTGRVVPSTAEIGYRRYIPSQARFQGTPRRLVFSTTRFRVPGLVPAKASLWANVPTWRIVSDSQTRVMALASHLVGGSVGNYLGIVPSANNAPPPTGWDQPGYDDSYWPYCISRVGGLLPYPTPDPAVLSIDFDWRWPNNTGDYSPSFGYGGQPTADPSFAINLFRRTFGLPLDPGIAAATSGNLYVGISSGVFVAQVGLVEINGIPLPYFGNNLNNPSANINIWTVPSSVLRPGNNVIAFSTFVYLCFGIFGDSAQFELNLTYQPPVLGAGQVIG